MHLQFPCPISTVEWPMSTACLRNDAWRHVVPSTLPIEASTPCQPHSLTRPSVNACSVWQTSPRHHTPHTIHYTHTHHHHPSALAPLLLWRRVSFCIAINVIMVLNCIQKYPLRPPQSGTHHKNRHRGWLVGRGVRAGGWGWCIVAWPPAICV